MPMIKYFSSPRMALLWLLARQNAANLLALAIAWATMAFFLTRALHVDESQMNYRILGPISNVLLIFTANYRSRENDRPVLLANWEGVHGHLPVFWPQIVRVDLHFIALSASLLSICFLFGSWIAFPAGLLSGPGVLFVPALWFVLAARPVIGAVRIVTSMLAKIALATGSIITFAFVIYAVLSVFPDDGAPMPNLLPLTCLVAIPAVMLLARAILTWTGPRLWRRERESLPVAIKPNQLVFVESPPEREPFETVRAAYQWFFTRRLADLATQTVEWLMVACCLLLVCLGLWLDHPNAITPYIASSAGFVYLTNLRYLERIGAVHNLPVSLWSAAVNHFRLITVCAGLFYAVCYPIYIFELVSINGPGGASPFDAIWLLWILWAGLSYAPLFLVECVSLLLGEAYIPPQIRLLLVVALAAMIVGRDLVEGISSARDVGLALVPVLASTVGLAIANAGIADSAASWTAREILGSVIFLSLLRYNAATHRIPPIAALRIVALLVLCVGTAATVFSLFGPPATPNIIVDIFSGLGLVAPIFLPLLWVPHAIEWTRSRGRRAAEPAGKNEHEVWENLR